jgi:hypothetical protein
MGNPKADQMVRLNQGAGDATVASLASEKK